jgi:tRNA G18 (ribose-2'-O)-methylase SpoU
MPISSFEIRVCTSCGLRYPLTEGNAFGARCPHCLGETRVALTMRIHTEKISAKQGEDEEHEQVAVLLDNIRSAWNVGSILRSADGFGFDHAYFCGITPTPQKEAVTKTSLGAEEFIAWSYHKDAVELIKKLKGEGWKIYALEEGKQAVDIGLASTLRMGKAVLALGNEVTGVDPSLLKLADEIIYIPMRGGKRSFNVSVAFAVAAYALNFRQKKNRRNKSTSKAETKPRTTSQR